MFSDCGDPPTTSNGQFNASAGTDYLSEAHLECIEKFFPVNETLITIVCDASGHWTDPQTTCFTPGEKYQHMHLLFYKFNTGSLGYFKDTDKGLF